MVSVLRAVVVGCVALAALAACAPRLSPPYRDFERRGALESLPPDSLTARLVGAVQAAGWTVVPSDAAAVVATAPRRVAVGVFSTTDASLDLVPLGDGFVRVMVRGESRSFLGGRTKVFALSPSLRRAVLGPLSAALADAGLVALGTPRDRDDEATE